MKLLVTGVSGQVGSEVYNLSGHQNYGTYFVHKPKNQKDTFLKMDIRDRLKIFDIVKKIKPDWIVHCAAATNVDWCETDKDQAWEMNVGGTKNLVDASKEVNSKFLYISTDYVFDGSRGNYKETDKTNPINFYGKTKLEGELHVKNLENYLIMRTSHVVSPKSDKFVWILEKLKSGRVEIAYDMISSPTLASELAEAILKSIKKELNGVYHSAGNECISRYDFAKKVAKVFDYEESEIKPIKMQDLDFIAKRPQNSSLDISKILKEGINFSNVNDSLERLKTQINSSGI